MAVDPILQALLTQMEAAGAPALSAGTPAEARVMFTQLAGMIDAAFPGGRVAVGEITDAAVAGLPVRVYRPAGVDGAVPTTVMFHGGGFVIGDIASYDDQARMLCAGTRGVVVSVEYRLAPEAPYPAGADDCEAVTREVLAHVEAYGGDPDRVGVAGDSAGGNLAAVVAQRLVAEPAAHPLAAQLLWYPAVDLADDDGATYPSRQENAEGYFLTAQDMRWFEGHYAPGEGASPLRGTLAGLPPAVVATAQYDPLRDEGVAYATALEKAGVTTVATTYAGLIHGFTGFAPISPACQTATDETIAAYVGLLG